MTLPPNIWDAYWSEAKPGTEAALERVVAETQRTPTAFNWTPVLSAVFPARLTMSQLLAIWEAMRDAAVYTPLGASAQPVADADGWIEWSVRNPLHLPPDQLVCVKYANIKSQFKFPVRALDGSSRITHWRPVP